MKEEEFLSTLGRSAEVPESDLVRCFGYLIDLNPTKLQTKTFVCVQSRNLSF